MNKNKRINRTIKSINDYSDDVNNKRTMKASISLTKELKEKLDILLEDADEKRIEILKNLMNIFYNNPIDLIESAGETINITKNNKNIEKIEGVVSPINGYSVYKGDSLTKDKNGNDKESTKYFCVKDDDICYDDKNKIIYHASKDDKVKQDIRGIELKLKKDKDTGSEKFVISKFSNQQLNNILSPSLRPTSRGNGDYVSKTLYKNLKGKIIFKNDFNSGIFIESVYDQVSSEVCSFLEKYYTIQSDIQNTIKENLKNMDSLDESIKVMELPISIQNKKENDEYNKIAKQNNVLINLAKQKYESETKADKDDDYKKRFQLFKILKGFPSFPIVEKQHEINYNDLDELLKPYINDAISWWNSINDKQMQAAMSHFCDRIIYKLFKYYYKIDDVVPNNENHEYELNSWKQEYLNNKSPIEIILERIDKKIDGIKKYLEIQQNNGITDNQSQKQLTEWLRGKSLIAFEYLRQKDDKTDFAKTRGEFDLKSSMNTGIFARDENKRSKVFEIDGFSSNKKSCILVESLKSFTRTGLIKQRFSLAFNVSKSNGGFKIDDNGKYTGYLKTTGGKTELVKLSFDEKGTFVLPLNFGKRYAREYLYNENINFENLSETLSNARIIKEWDYKNKEFNYFVAITFTKLKGKNAKTNADKIDFETIIGADRGNILPIAITMTDLNGKFLKRPKIKVCEDFAKKHREIEKLKKEQSSKVGQYEADLKKKAKNLSKATIEKIGAELLHYATKYKALIVLEDLNREFGVRKMMATNQYTKLEDYLTRKLKENGLTNGNVLVNTKSGLLAKVVAQHTSRTCSRCGFVASSEKLKNVPLELKNIGGKNIWFANLDGKEISMDTECQISKKKGHDEKFNANKRIIELKQKDTKKNKELIERILLAVLNPRKTQAEYICPICGYKDNADQQASLNIARRWVFIDSPEYKEYKKLKNTKNSITYWKAWENFCKRNKDLWNQKN